MRKEKKQSAVRVDKDVLKKILLALKGYRLELVLSLLLALLSVAAALYVPILIGRAIDLIAGKGQVQFDAILPHRYEALTDVEVVILHLAKPKRF